MSGKPVTPEKFSSTVGVAAHFAAMVDAVLINVLRVVSGLSPRKAKALYFAPDAQPTRYRIIRALAEEMPPEQVADIDAIIEAAQRVYNKRNELAHSFIAVLDKHTPHARAIRVHLRQQKQQAKPLTADYLKSMIEPVRADCDLVDQGYAELCRKLGIQPELRF